MIGGLGALLTAGWTIVALAGGATVGTMHVDPLAAAVGAGATALGATLTPRSGPHELLVPPLVLLALPLAAALAIGGHSALPILGCAVACLLTVGKGWRAAGLSLLAGGAGVGLLAAGLAVGRGDLHAGVLTVETSTAAALLAGGAAGLIVASGLAPRGERALRFLVLPGLVVGWVVAPRVDGVALAAAALATAAVVVARGRPTALAFAAVAVAAVGPARPAAALLAAATVLMTAAGPALSWPAVLPGAVAAALALAAGSASVETVAAGAAVAVAALGLAGAIRGRITLEPRLLPAVALIAWLTLVPATWTWAGRARVEHYQQGATRALAAALLVTVLAWMTGQLRPPAPEWRRDGW
ncbi:MAG: hypothetical protein QOJ09_619 [Actinomycetota bacterium]|nr:hypothetical protein [Actinomycetota bacterium]